MAMRMTVKYLGDLAADWLGQRPNLRTAAGCQLAEDQLVELAAGARGKDQRGLFALVRAVHERRLWLLYSGLGQLKGVRDATEAMKRELAVADRFLAA